MIRINIPNNNIDERKYIIDILFNEFLGLKYKLEVGTSKLEVYEIELENGNKLIFEDHFFNKFPIDLEYLKFKNIPSDINFQVKRKNSFIVEDEIPIIYGSHKLETSDQKSKTVISGIDIFASSFFMLTRWEEYVNKNRDSHERFPAAESIAFKNGFLDRPVVNEYVEMLWNMLKFLGIAQQKKHRKFQLILTHDVDTPLKYPDLTSGLKGIVGDIVKRKNFKLAIQNSLLKIKTILKIKNDPFDTFDYLMELSERMGVKSYFFFMGKGKTKFDNMYKSDNSFILELIKKIKQRGHYLGIHPTYNAYNDAEQFKEEKQELEKNFETKMIFGREHFLRFEVPHTWQIWENNGMAWDSTLGYADKEGFRCGVCYEYSVFNIVNREKLTLKEKPLIVMDASFGRYQSNIMPEEMENTIKELRNKVKKYNGDFVFLWHNSNLNTAQWMKYKNVYENIVFDNWKEK